MSHTYVTREEFIRGKRATLLSAVSMDIIDEYLARTAELIDSHLQVPYKLPLSKVNQLIIEIQIKIALYEILKNEVGFRPNSTEYTMFRQDYEDAMRDLRSIKTGDLTLAHTKDSTPTQIENIIGFASTKPSGWGRRC